MFLFGFCTGNQTQEFAKLTVARQATIPRPVQWFLMWTLSRDLNIQLLIGNGSVRGMVAHECPQILHMASGCSQDGASLLDSLSLLISGSSGQNTENDG